MARAGSGSVDAVAFDPRGQKVAAVTSSGELIVWEVKGLEQLASVALGSVAMQSVAFAPDGERIVVGGEDGKLRFWDPRTNEHVVTLETGLFTGSFVGFTPDGSTIVAGGGDGMALLETRPPSGGVSAQTRAHDVRRVVDVYQYRSIPKRAIGDRPGRIYADHDGARHSSTHRTRYP